MYNYNHQLDITRYCIRIWLCYFLFGVGQPSRVRTHLFLLSHSLDFQFSVVRNSCCSSLRFVFILRIEDVRSLFRLEVVYVVIWINRSRIPIVRYLAPRGVL
ncbi:unnamed protein product [Acanthoscelides obtectus]|uniref:Uncharacterized protein n=1 Tax=Acanthoscelides obtectus TaxID=200917 RepID=A0A9P0LXM0_ACAOB|nr:unnamed protein product [Acanthoscelides obtectus]CAK1665065.1 hypothetical protein AOBTE_LOCUS24639 [Acanthoscelides obtectus]